MPIAPVTLFDSFSRTQSDSWGTLDSGQVWGGTDTSFDTDGAHGLMTVAANASYKTAFIDLDDYGIPKQESSEVLILVKWSASALYPITDFGPMLSRTASNTFYYATFQHGYSECAIGCYINGTRYELNRGSFSATKGSYYWMRFRRDGTGLKLRIWKLHTAEPGSWTLTSGFFSGSNPPGAGDIGVWRRGLSDSYTAHIHQFYGYTLEDSQAALPIQDTFERTVDDGWGYSTSGHTWEGNYAWDTTVTSNVSRGDVTDPGDGRARVAIADLIPRLGIIGQSVSGDIETLAKVSMNTNSGQTSIFVGARGAMRITNGATEFTGYYVRFHSNATSISIWKKTSFTSDGVSLATSGAITAISSANVYWIRFQIVGTTLQARIWVDGTAEPSTWNVSYVDASAITSGRMYIATSQSTTTQKEIYVHEIQYGTPTPATTLHTATGTLTTTAGTDTTFSFEARYTNDTDNDNSIDVEYKKGVASTWTTFSGTKTRQASPRSWIFTLTGLEPKTQYNVRVTFSDPDTVTGTNPVERTITTTATGITAGTLTAALASATSVLVTQSYTDDTDNDSSAALDYRITTQEVQLVNDTFTGSPGVLLQNHAPDVGETWARHTTSSSGANLALLSNRVVFEPLAKNDTVLYYNTASPPSTEYEVSANWHANNQDFRLRLGARIDTVANTGYFAQYNRVSNIWEISRINAGAFSTLATAPASVVLNQIYHLRFIVTDAYKAFLVDGVEVCRTTDNNITAIGKAGIRGFFDGVLPVSTYTAFDDFLVTYRTPSGTWTSAGAMTADRTAKTFTLTPTGLTSDVVYEFKTTLSDPDGVYGPSPQSVTITTIGQGVELVSIAASPQQTTAIVDVVYDFDTNNNSSLAVQYRNTKDFLWTTVSTTSVTVDRGIKKFSAILPSLSASTTYEVKATISDPNGVIEDSPEFLTTLFTTTGFLEDPTLQVKHYFWKVYDPQGNYITTWHDAGEPEFALHENGGVSDLSVVLSRPVASIDNEKLGIAFQNRIDVWCIDPASDGMGVNLVPDPEFTLGAWTLGANASISTTAGPDDSAALVLNATSSPVVTRSSPIYLRNDLSPIDNKLDVTPVPVVLKAVAKAVGSKLVLSIEAYDVNDVKLQESEQVAETVGTMWQQLRVEFLPPSGTNYLRVAVKNDNAGTMYLDKVALRAKEVLIYRGRIETYTPKIDQSGESIEVDILGLISLLSDDYIDFLQFVITQPQKDQVAGRENLGPMDPGDILRLLLQQAAQQNPYFMLYATNESIRNTGIPVQYTFRNQQIRNAFDKLRGLCPPGWHYYVEADGLVVLRGPEHGKTHVLRRGVEIMNISIEKSIRNLKNYVQVKGRQDEDSSEPDGHGSIFYVAFDQESIDAYGKRVLHIQDANITDPDTAETVGNGRLDEHNREEQRTQCQIPDEKSIIYTGKALRGYNIEDFRPGDSVVILDPIAGPRLTYWDSLIWDQSKWDYENIFAPLPEPVPIRTIQFHGSYARLELSERQPSGIGDFGRLYRWLATKDAEETGG